MILINCLVICACILSCRAQDTSLDNLIADIFKTDDTDIPTSSQTPISPVPVPVTVKPKDSSPLTPSTNSQTYESCGDQKECVPRWLCANDTINTNGEGIIDIRIDTGSPCKNYLHLCCDLPNKVMNINKCVK